MYNVDIALPSADEQDFKRFFLNSLNHDACQFPFYQDTPASWEAHLSRSSTIFASFSRSESSSCR